MRRLALSGMTALALVGCAMNEAAPDPAVQLPAALASADIIDATGRSMGTATVSQVGDSLRVRVEGAGLPSGAHGAHIHTTGVCAAPGFESAGPHWNPTARQHGKSNPAGMHRGDLPNLMIGTDGRGSIEYTVPGAMLTGGEMAMLDGDGAAIVIHAQADDYRTDPSGNSGGRLACGAFR